METMKCSSARVCKMSKEKHLGRTVEEEGMMNEGTVGTALLTLGMTWTDPRRHFHCTMTADHDMLCLRTVNGCRETSVVAGHVKISGLLKVIPRDQKHDKLRIVQASSVFTMHTC